MAGREAAARPRGGAASAARRPARQGAELREKQWREENQRRDGEAKLREEEWSEENQRRDAEIKRREEEWREETKRYREERAKSDARRLELREECRDLRIRYERELTETRRSTREILARMERNEKNIEAALKLMGEQIVAMRKEVHENTDAVKAQTQAILKFVDRFEDFGGRAPA